MESCAEQYWLARRSVGRVWHPRKLSWTLEARFLLALTLLAVTPVYNSLGKTVSKLPFATLVNLANPHCKSKPLFTLVQQRPTPAPTTWNGLLPNTSSV